MIDWAGAALSILRAIRKEKSRVDPKYMVVKPRALSDDNLLRGISLLRGVLAMVPPASLGATALGLGAIGFNIWKRIALSKEYDQIQYPPIDPNLLRLSIELDPQLKKHYGQLVLDQNWGDETITEMEVIYNDFHFLTDAEMLQTKYPHIDREYIKSSAILNKRNLQADLTTLEQNLLKVSQSPEIDHNIREAFELLKKLFPVMNDWALFNSQGFNDVLEIIDTVF